jgi:hypothetical protein
MDIQERQELLEQAQEKINEAIELIRVALEGTNQERGAEVYIIGHLDSWANGETESFGIPNMISDLNSNEDED